ncbi:MAG TPA: CbiX/SirB N-terminal domain-containing protein [Burkholderiaceae bacterium]|nr:CbiX/SirB N-terminal domain-containing protein [Burkholderiaceae bacterium]
MTPIRRGLLLFAHGARDPRWAAPFEAMLARLRARRPERVVRLAFLELMTPDLPHAAEELAAEGCRRIDIVPLFLGMGGHLRNDLPPLVDRLRERLPGVEFRLHGAVGEAPAVIDALAAHALDLTDLP